MKAIIQRVNFASVAVGDEIISSIRKGLCVLVGISNEDTVQDIEYVARKILNTKLFENESGGRWSKNVMEENLEILCISQFTLYSNLKKNKPDFHKAMGAEKSENMYMEFLKNLQKNYCSTHVKDGKFGAYMKINLENDGPVTIVVESPTNLQKEEKVPLKTVTAKEMKQNCSQK